jgi:hypothetical protein
LDKAPQGTRDGVLQAAVLSLLLESIPTMQTKRWREGVREAFRDSPEVVHAEEDFWDALSGFNYLPDAFVVDREAMRLDFFEVEITSLLTKTKLEAYSEFVTLMHYYGIEFSLFSVNQHGHINQIPLMDHFVDWMKRNLVKAPEPQE